MLGNVMRSEPNPTYEAETAQFLAALLADANDRDTDATRAHLETIQLALEQDTDGFLTLLFGGSVAKQTWVRDLSDVDALVILNDHEFGQMSPEEVCSAFVDRLKARLSRTDISRDGFAVDVQFADGKIQLVPALQQDDAVHIPSADCRTWAPTWPQAFREALTEVNQQCNRRVVPVIKLVKMLVAEMPEDRRPTGYHVEALAVEAFRGYAGNFTTKAMLKHLVTYAQSRVMSPMLDVSAQSPAIDINLGLPASLPRQLVSDAFGRIARRIQLADARGSLDQWRELFNDQ
ncbi:MAG: nucleotidyltransferase [Deltaproteobacteria bacterium]|nr:MAG: nucleotidyltransferase [Deltaproteobacteria bacterium]